MKKIIALFSIILLYSCSQDDSPLTGEQAISGGTITTFQIVNIQVDNLNKDEFEGTMDGVNVTLSKTSTNTISFIVDENINVGERILDINSLGIKIKYEVTETVLTETVDNTLEKLSDVYNGQVSKLGNNPSEIFAKNVVNNYNEALEQMSTEDRESIAKVYHANQDFFNNLFKTDYSLPQGKTTELFDYSKLTNRQLTVSLGLSVVGMSYSVFTAYNLVRTPKPLLALPFVVSGCLAYVLSDEMVEEVRSRNWVYLEVLFDKVTSAISNRTQASALTFINGTEKSLDFDLTARGLDNSDESSTNSTINSFFKALGDFNGIINNLNGTIEFVNNIPFVNIAQISNVEVGTSSQATSNADEDFFKKMSFSIGNSNLQMGDISFADGNVKLTIDIIDESIVTDFVETTLNYSYSDGTDTFTGSFPIKVKKEFELTGEWKFSYFVGAGHKTSWLIDFGSGGNGNGYLEIRPDGSTHEINQTYRQSFSPSSSVLRLYHYLDYFLDYDPQNPTFLRGDAKVDEWTVGHYVTLEKQ